MGLVLADGRANFFAIAGELDDATAKRLDELDGVHGPLVLELHAVTFINSGGVAALVRLYQRCQHDGCTFRIEASSAPVERVLRIVNLYDLLTGDGAQPSGDGARLREDLQPRAPAKEPGAAAVP